MTQSRYDPIPDLAALIDGMEAVASASSLGAPNHQLIERLAYLLTGPYARLRGGLLLDFADEGVSTEDAIREALADFAAQTEARRREASWQWAMTEAERLRKKGKA